MDLKPARTLLEHLMAQFPIQVEGQHHAIVLRDDDPSGLDLAICTGPEGLCQVIHLDEADLELNPDEITDVISSLIPPDRLE